VEPQTLEWFESVQRKEPRVRVLRYDLPFNYASINNFGEKHARGSVIGLVNNDVEVISPGWLTDMVGHVCRQDVGCVGAKLYYSDGTIQHGGVIIGIGGVAGHSHKYAPANDHGYFRRLLLTQAVSAVTGACLLVRREVYREVNGLDEQNLAIAFNDVDFCLKVRQAGYRSIWTPYAELYHHESVSRGSEDTPEKAARFQAEAEFMKKKWGEQLSRDPFYSPHLTLDREDFSIGGVVR
jgi:GT2 family glycosyltransferase